jgi:hypothetical protein
MMSNLCAATTLGCVLPEGGAEGWANACVTSEGGTREITTVRMSWEASARGVMAFPCSARPAKARSRDEMGRARTFGQLDRGLFGRFTLVRAIPVSPTGGSGPLRWVKRPGGVPKTNLARGFYGGDGS